MRSSVANVVARWTPKSIKSKSVLLANWKVIILHGLLWCLLSLLTVLSLAGSYVAVYYWYIPAERIVQPVYFDYTVNRPIASTNIALQKDISYDISLNILIPDMAGLSESLGPVVFNTYFDKDGKTVRPMLVVYRSWPVRFALLLLRMIPVVLGLAHEATPHRVFLREGYQSALGGSTDLTIEMVGRLPTYSVNLEAVAHFEGLKYLMYYWKWTFAAMLIGTLSLLAIFSITVVLGVSLYVRARKQLKSLSGYDEGSTSDKSTLSEKAFSETSNRSISDLSASIKLPTGGLRPSSLGLSTLRQRFHTTEELRVPNGNLAEESDEDDK